MTTTTAETELHVRPLDSPYGPLTIVGSTKGLRAVLWYDDALPRTTRIARERDASDAIDTLDEAVHQLGEYFAGTRTQFELPLDLRGTDFQLEAWHALAEIPYGETRTYTDQAARLGRRTAVRAVGAANGRNPLPIVLPCHRVIGRDGSLRGFAGGLDVKAALLEFERMRVASRDGVVPTAVPAPG